MSELIVNSLQYCRVRGPYFRQGRWGDSPHLTLRQIHAAEITYLRAQNQEYSAFVVGNVASGQPSLALLCTDL